MNEAQILETLNDFIKIRSVSANPKLHAELFKAVSFLSGQLTPYGFHCETLELPDSPPCLIASRILSSSAPTIGIYGHYDVQPEDPVEQWNSKPFELARRDGKLWGRGVADNKGHIIENIAAIQALIQANTLNKNIVFVIEGEEETGSVHFERYIKKYFETDKKPQQIDLQAAEAWYVTDTGMRAKNIPQIFYGLRGLVYFEIELKTGERDLHSGVYGNRVLNPIQVLADLFSQMKDAQSGRITIPGFHNTVRKISSAEMKGFQALIRPEEEERREAQTYQLTTIDNIPPSLVTKLLPSFEVHGIQSGYTGAGSKTVIPCIAKAKFSFRLVEHQKALEIEALVRNYIKVTLPKGVSYDLKTHSLADSFFTNIDVPQMKRAAHILKKEFGNETIFNRSGGSIPAAEIFQRLFEKPVILTGFTLPDDNIHAPNENFDEELFFKGIGVLEKLYS